MEKRSVDLMIKDGMVITMSGRERKQTGDVFIENGYGGLQSSTKKKNFGVLKEFAKAKFSKEGMPLPSYY